MGNLFVHELRSRWAGILGWGVGMAAFGALYVSVWPQAEEQMISLSDLTIYQVLGVSLGSFEAYLGSVLLLFLPLLLGIYSLTTATKMLAGEEEDGTLELVLARPLRRWKIVVAKALALGVALIAILLISGLADAAVLAAVKTTYETDLTPLQLFWAITTAWPVTMAFAMIALFLGALAPSRRVASMTATVILVASYFGTNVAGMVPSLDIIKPFSLFTYFDTSADAFSHGPAASDVVTLVAVATLFLTLAAVTFGMRNAGAGTWAWQRGRSVAAE